jgi:elongation factor Ts
MITTEQIKELRDSTGISVMQCKKALEEAGGDLEKARVILRKKSGELAAKKSDRTFGAGIIQSYLHSTGKVAALVELVCETDFVSGNEEFKTLARDIAMHVTAANPKFLTIDEVTEESKSTAKEVFLKEIADSGKKVPKEMEDKILEGKLATYFADQVLMNQAFIKNPDVTIEALITAAIQKFGEKIAVARFVRFAVLEK